MIDDLIFSRLTSRTELTNLVATRVYPGSAPQGVVIPYVVFWLVSSVENAAHGDGVEAKPVTARYQFDCYAPTSAEMKAIRLQVKNALRGWRVPDTVFGTAIDDEQDLFDDTLSCDHGILDAFIYHKE